MVITWNGKTHSLPQVSPRDAQLLTQDDGTHVFTRTEPFGLLRKTSYKIVLPIYECDYYAYYCYFM